VPHAKRQIGEGCGPLNADENVKSQSPSKLTTWQELFWLSVLSLFCELLIIRWLATEIRIFAYFKNLPLMSAFLGLGLGFIWTKDKRDYFQWSGLSLIYLSGLLMFALGLKLTFLSFVDPFKYMLFGVGLDSDWSRSHALWTSISSLLVMLVTFALSTCVFIGMGQRMGKLFSKLKPLQAYSINVAGALAGSILFSALCWLQTSPGVWLIVAGMMLILIVPKPSHFAVVALGLLYSLWLGDFIAVSTYGNDFVKTVWSPYYRIDVVRVRAPSKDERRRYYGYTVRINYDNFQQLFDCTKENLAQFPQNVQDKMTSAFEGPFHLLPQKPNNVLILGAGNGTDVAAAIRCGVNRIDAIEIDPAIARIGKDLHPERPYFAPQVTLHVEDARTFLEQNKDKKYDVVLFAFVDSHAAFSALSSLRMDNYLFTKESLSEAARLVSPNGIIVVKFLSMADWLWDRHSKAVAEATGMKPLGYCKNNGVVDVGVLISGPATKGKLAKQFPVAMAERKIDLGSAVPLSCDDWPFLFLQKRELPSLYLLPIFAVIGSAFFLVLGHFREGAQQSLNWQMFFLGMGFMLLEVRAMADLSLLFGSTWLVNSAVISGVLVVILLANLLASKISNQYLPWLGAGLIASLAASTLIHVSELAAFGTVSAQLAGVIIYLFPLVFASTVFALLFKSTTSSNSALAFNLIGGLVGVCLEYLSMWLGLRALGWLAIAIYCIVLLIPTLYQKRDA